MVYYSLNHQSPAVGFAEATIRGQAPDKGLYYPEQIPALPKKFIENLKNLSKEEIGFTVLKPFVAGSIPEILLQNIIQETINFDFPVVQLNENIYTLELFHGPTLAFKDVGARFMSRCLGYFNRNGNRLTTVLVATSGDTGGAVANGFLGVPGVEVIILYPAGKVSPVQELQLTTCGQNITALKVNGNFDDCQAIVKHAFNDADLNKKLLLTSANSINVARWLPQQLYYLFALQQWSHTQPPVFSVPSGNFGNICAGMVAHVAGLPVQHFIAACNANDVVTRYLKIGNYEPAAAVPTISNAMDVGNPSNFIRIMELYSQEFDSLKHVLSSYSITDKDTKIAIKEVHQEFGYTLDPHGAVAYLSLKHYLQNNSHQKGIFLETAHPVKFPEIVEEAINHKIDIPETVQYLLSRQKKSLQMNADYNDFKEWLLNKN